MGSVNFEYLGTPSGILKLLEILFVVITFGIFRGVPVEYAEEDANYFGGGTLVTCLIITPLLLTCYLMHKTEIQGTIMELTLNSIFFIFLFAVSVRSFIFWRDVPKVIDGRSQGMTLASFSLIASIAYLCDIPFAAKNFKDAYEMGDVPGGAWK